jgi:hypothetical protein
VVPIQQYISNLDRPDLTWDGIHHALDPVRRLVAGDDALISTEEYAEHRHTRQRVMARVAPVASSEPWAFLALAGPQHGAPCWLILEGQPLRAIVGVEAVAERLRAHLQEDPPNVVFDEKCEWWLDQLLGAAARAEGRLLPRRMQRALEQMATMTGAWGDQAWRRGEYQVADQWWRLRKIARLECDEEDRLDPYLVGEAWWDLGTPTLCPFSSAPPSPPLHAATRPRHATPGGCRQVCP